MAVAVLLVLALAAGVAWFLLRGDGGILGGRETPEFSFKLGRVSGKSPQGGVPTSDLRDAAEDVRASLDAFYVAAFIDPEKWEGGTFPEALEAFTGPAARRARRDLGDLTLGPAAEQIEFVKPRRGKLAVSFLLQGRQPFAAVANTDFRARGELEAGGTLDIDHAGRYLMRRSGGRWLIVGYQVKGSLEEAAPKPAGTGASP